MATYIVEINGYLDDEKLRRKYEIEASSIQDAKQKATDRFRSEVPRIKIIYKSVEIKE